MVRRRRWGRWRDERGRFVSKQSVAEAKSAWAAAAERSGHVEGDEHASRVVFERTATK